MAFTAIGDGKLVCDDLVSTPQFDLKSWMLDSIQGIEHRGFNPSKANWCRQLMISPAAFDKLLKKALQDNRFPALPKRRAGAKPTKRDEIKKFVGKNKRRFSTTTNKEIRKRAIDELGIEVSERTVRRARGRK
jgi:hypothetical protein